MSGLLLQIKNLSVQFSSGKKNNVAVDGISFALNKGETLGIVGESGSGKSVTALSIMQLIGGAGKISGGEIHFNSQKQNINTNLLSLSEKQMRTFRGNEIAMIFQEPMTSLNPVISCGNQVAEAIILHKKISKKKARAQTVELFTKVQLPRPDVIYHSYPHQLSGGQKQRVMIAMAISCNPSILIADEPTTALDVTVQKSVLALLKQLQSETGMSIIFISHDLGVVAEIANRVLVMYKGKIVEEKNVNDIFKNPQHPYTKGLIACRPPLEKKLRILPTVGDFMTEENGILIEKKKNISDVLANAVVTKEEAQKHLEQLYSNKPLLKVEGLKKYFALKKGVFGKTYDVVKAVDDVTIEIFPGETLGLVGESGCGKTTLGRTILQLIKPTSGKVIFNETNLTELDTENMRQMRKRIQIIFQDPYSSLNPSIPIGNSILEPMRVHGLFSSDSERKNKVFELLDKVNLKQEYFNRYPFELSGGERQRVCIARALALNPEFIICDECVSSLDVSVQAQVLNLLNELKKEFGFTYIFISHDLSVVKFMSDRMAVMNNGKIVEMGIAEEVYHNPKSEYTKNLIAAIPKEIN